MKSELENIFDEIQDNTIAVIKMLLSNKSVEEIAKITGLTLKEITEIKGEFESK